MSIASEITRIQDNISDAYTAASAKGATLPTTQNSANLASTISTISGGGVDTTGWIPKTIDANGKLVCSSTKPNFTGVQDIGDYALYNCEHNNTSLTGAVSFPDLTAISGSRAMSYAFMGCSGLTSISFPTLTTVSGNNCMEATFQNCSGLTSVSFPSLNTISGKSCMSSILPGCSRLSSVDFSALTTVSGEYSMQGAFNNCTSLTSVDFSALTTVSGRSCMQTTFYGCSGLTSVSFPSLNTISGQFCMMTLFQNCRNLKSVSFPALKSNSFGSYTNQFTNMLQSVTGCTIHFPSNLDPQTGSTVISDLSGYPNFSGTNTVLAFDLPATE